MAIKSTKFCKGCGQRFISDDVRRQYCSDACKQSAYRKRKRAQPKLI